MADDRRPKGTKRNACDRVEGHGSGFQKLAYADADHSRRLPDFPPQFRGACRLRAVARSDVANVRMEPRGVRARRRHPEPDVGRGAALRRRAGRQIRHRPGAGGGRRDLRRGRLSRRLFRHADDAHSLPRAPRRPRRRRLVLRHRARGLRPHGAGGPALPGPRPGYGGGFHGPVPPRPGGPTAPRGPRRARGPDPPQPSPGRHPPAGGPRRRPAARRRRAKAGRATAPSTPCSRRSSTPAACNAASASPA